MLIRSITFILTLLISLTVFSAENIVSKVKTKVDLNAVIKLGTVTPVNGISAAGQPNKDAFKVFAKEGYTTVIDLRMDNEDRGLNEPKVIAELGMNYISLPIGRDGITFKNAKILSAHIDQADGPVLLHCGSSNRVGAMLTLSEILAGADQEDALAFGRSAGLKSLEDQVIKVLETNKVIAK